MVSAVQQSELVMCVCVCVGVCVCVCVLTPSVVSDFMWPHGLLSTKLLCPWNYSRQEYWSGLSFPTSGGLLNSRIKAMFLGSPELAGTWVQEESTCCGATKPNLCAITTDNTCLEPVIWNNRSPHLPYLEKAQAHQWRPRAAKKIIKALKTY